MPLHRRIAAAGFLPFVASSSSSQASPTCEVVKVTGGVAPGSYALSAVLQSVGGSGGGDVYEQTGPDGETAAVLLFTQGSVRRGRGRRRRLEPQQQQQQQQHGEQQQYRRQGDGGVLVSAGSSYGNWGQRGGRSLSECASGFWINQSGDGGSSTTTAAAAAAAGSSSPDLDSVVYPVNAASDCAGHPAEITADWFSVACAACELELSEALLIECDDDYEAGGDIGGNQPTPSPSPAARDESSRLDTSSPASSLTASPEIVFSDGGVVPDEAATPSPSSDGPEPARTLVPTAALVTPAPVDVAPSEQPATPSPSGGGVVNSSNSSSPSSSSSSSSSNSGGSDASPAGGDGGSSAEGDSAGTSGAAAPRGAITAGGGMGAGACAAVLLFTVLAVIGSE